MKAASFFMGGTLMLISQAVTAQEPTCPDDPSTDLNGAQVTECVKELLRERRETTRVPAGAVMAFDRPDGCPTGWIEFTAAQGRFILGVDGTKYKLAYEKGQPSYQTGGADVVTLGPDHMPSHSHTVVWGVARTNGTGSYVKYEASGPDNDGRMFTTSPVGGGGAHENMPPYVALYFCKYEGAG